VSPNDNRRSRELADLRYHWDGAYTFGHDDLHYWARRADNGELITDPDPSTFRRKVQADYRRCPVPRS
jgi:hypothetical protein